MTPAASPRVSRDSVFLLALAFAVAGLVLHPLFLAGAMLCGADLLLRQPAQRRAGFALAAFACVYFLVVGGYGVGKDMALRDNAAVADAKPAR